MNARAASSGLRAANDDDVTAAVDLLFAVARGAALAIPRSRCAAAAPAVPALPR